jgi:thermitase
MIGIGLLAVLVLGLSPSAGAAQSTPGVPGVKERGTKPATVVRRGQVVQTKTIDQQNAPDGKPMRAGSLVVKFRQNAGPAARAAAHGAAASANVEALLLADTVRVDVAPSAVAKALAGYQADPNVESASPDYVATATRELAQVAPAYVPTDTRLAEQWGLSKILATEAWDLSISNPTITIAVLDCGVYSGSSLVPDPADGLPGHKDIRDKVILEQDFTGSTTGADDYCDHGTHVAGTASATTDNGYGVAGVGFTASILNGKVLDDTGSGTLAQLINGLTWAATNGATVINMSLSWPAGTSCAALSGLQAAIDNAWAANAVLVAAAGNSGLGSANAPASCDKVLAVAATDANDSRASFSNYGANVHVAAPGVSILSTDYVGGFVLKSGTSMASPHVAGLAALVAATPFGATNDAIVTRIKTTADPIPGTGTLWTDGRINAARAVGVALAPAARPLGR